MRKRWPLLLLLPLGILALGIASVWEPDRSVAELTPRWAPSPSQFLRIGAHTVHLRDEGPRKDSLPIVLLHGTSASLHTWDGWTAELASSRRVIRFDLPGFGLTGPAPDDDYRLATYATLVVAVMDSLRVNRAIIAGNSLGGAIAARVAVNYPTRVSALVLEDAATYPIASVSVPLGFRLARNPIAARLLQNILPRSIVRSSVENVYGDPARVTEELVDRYFELTLREGNRASLPKRFATSEPSDTLAMRSINVPTLILWGGRDGLIPPSNAKRFERDIAGSRTVEFAELGHVPHEEDPIRSVREVQRFLAQLDSLPPRIPR